MPLLVGLAIILGAVLLAMMAALLIVRGQTRKGKRHDADKHRGKGRKPHE